MVDDAGVPIADVLDDLYADAVHARLGPVWEGGVPSLAVWAPTAHDVALLLRERRVAMARGEDGVWRVSGDASWRDAEYAFEVTVFAPAVERVVTNVVTDPYSLALTLNSPPLRPGRARAVRGLAEAAATALLRCRDLRAAHPRLLDRRRDRPGRASRHLPRLHARRQRRDAPPARARRGRDDDRAPAAVQRHRDDRGGPRAPARSRPTRGLRARRRGAAAARRGDPRPRRLQLGLRPAALHDARGLLRKRSRRSARASSGRWSRALNAVGLRVVLDVVYNHTPAAGQHPRSILDRIVPGYYHRLVALGRARDLDLLRQHGERAADDGEADARLARDLGA